MHHRSGPALIQNINHSKVETEVGEMTFDPEENVWKGNEKELSIFHSGPSLISFKTSSDPEGPSMANALVFDSEKMVWVGNEDELDVFSEIEEPNDCNCGFKVGKEFSLTKEMKAEFYNREKEHKNSLRGWFTEERIPNNKHLYSIRNLPVSLIIQRTKSNPTLPEDPEDDFDDIDIPEQLTVVSNGDRSDSPIMLRLKDEKKVLEEWEDLQIPEGADLKLERFMSGLKLVEEAIWSEDEFQDDFQFEKIPPQVEDWSDVEVSSHKMMPGVARGNTSRKNSDDWSDLELGPLEKHHHHVPLRRRVSYSVRSMLHQEVDVQ
eukprot:TRINITY_DN8105_c0_g1_i1.p1 TRINITY_DN8105_c0_g1~~TRINITY_DN8105_c0_g1_i1.p1  ORF type:complete len:335 (+),score=91.82 TRINITY_DN8105_c0_g1_i1:48-1007(+)